MYKKQLLVAGLVLAVLLVTSYVYAGLSRSSYYIGLYNSLPEPRLVYPVGDHVVLARGDSLEFRWRTDLMGIDHFIFKLYKGYNMYVSDLIDTQSLPADVSSVKIKSELFVDGQVYTWSLVQVALAGQKSDRSFNSFRIDKK